MAPAPSIPPATLADIKARTDLAALAGRWTRLTRCGGEFMGLCPFHKEKTPSFTVVPKRGFYHCFGCGAHGGAVDFVMATEGLGFRDAVLALAADAGVAVEGAPAPARRPRPVMCAPVQPEEDARMRDGRRRRAYDIWRAAAPIDGTGAETYLVEVRRISCGTAGAAGLRFAQTLEYWHGDGGRPRCLATAPAMLAALRRPDGKFAALHATYLRPDGGGKLALHGDDGNILPAKKVFGAPAGAAIRLTPAAARLVVGEGIETVLSVVDATGLAGWCAYSLDNLAGGGLGRATRNPRHPRRFVPPIVPDPERPGMALPDECEHVTYLGDGDTKDLVMLEAKLRRAVRRQLDAGRRADYVITPTGRDFNDLLRGAA